MNVDDLINEVSGTNEEITEEKIKKLFFSVITTSYYLHGQINALYELDQFKCNTDELEKITMIDAELAERIVDCQIEMGFNEKVLELCKTLGEINNQLRKLYFDCQEGNECTVPTLIFNFFWPLGTYEEEIPV